MEIRETLYPPIVETYMPTFTDNSNMPKVGKIYFSHPVFNAEHQARAVQLSCRNQKTNQNVLDRKKYPSGIKIYNLSDNSRIDSQQMKYLELKDTDIEGGFTNNQYYKIQLRFMSVTPPAGEVTNNWIVSNEKNCSEWSKVCLLRYISYPTLQLRGLDQQNFQWTSSVLTLVGKLIFKDPNEQDKLKSYQTKLYIKNKGLVSDSGVIYPNQYNSPNEINYTFKYNLDEGVDYYLTVDYTTETLYHSQKEYSFSLIPTTVEKIPVKIILDKIPDIGCIQIKMEPLSGVTSKPDVIMFRRTSSESNFTIWEDIHEIRLLDRPLKYNWYDYTVKSGVWYKYCVQYIEKDKHGDIIGRGPIVEANLPQMLIFDDMFLCADKKQLKIKYNPQINSFKRNIIDTKIDTIGSKYPFIRRNGYMNYRQFSISGLISSQADAEQIFISENELYGNENLTELYHNFNAKYYMNNHIDAIYEREFREKVMDFLYNDSVKMLRTTTEGNILIRLTDINFTPETTLGRTLYSFSATAYEVAECSLDNLKKYNIHGGIIVINENNEIIDPEEGLLKRDIQKFGQVNDTIKANVDVVQTILKKKYDYLKERGFEMRMKYLSKMRLEFQDDPYLIHTNADGELEPLPAGASPDATTIRGYIAYINNTPIYINTEGIYELNYKIQISSLFFPVDTNVYINYLLLIQKIETQEHKTDVISYNTHVGQLWGTFGYKESIIQHLKNKYYGDYKRFYQELISVNGIKIEANPGTVFWLRDSYGKKLKRIAINDSGMLSYFDEDVVIESLFAYGIHLFPATEIDKQREILPENKFIDTQIKTDRLDKIQHPIMNGVYTLTNSKNTISLDIEEANINKTIEDTYSLIFEDNSEQTDKYIYYNGKWYPFTKNHDILCSVDAIIDYWCEVKKGVHVI